MFGCLRSSNRSEKLWKLLSEEGSTIRRRPQSKSIENEEDNKMSAHSSEEVSRVSFTTDIGTLPARSPSPSKNTIFEDQILRLHDLS